MNRSDYDVARIEKDRVSIIDLDLGNRSVTNDAEQVWQEIQLLWPNKRLIYRDSMGNWGEMIVVTHSLGVMRSFSIVFKNYEEHTPF